MLSVFDNLPCAACWQPTMLLRTTILGYADVGEASGECGRDCDFPTEALRSYAIRALSPYAYGGPAAHCAPRYFTIFQCYGQVVGPCVNR